MDETTRQPLKALTVFLDTEVSIDANFGFKSSPRMLSLTDLARRGRVQVLLTDVTVREIEANIKEALERAAATHRPERILQHSSLPQVKALFTPLDVPAIEREILGQLHEFIRDTNITVLPTSAECLAPVLDGYFARHPPFGPGKHKAEFPDAFALETLKRWSRATGRPVAVVSRDEGVKAACSAEHLRELRDEVAAAIDRTQTPPPQPRP